MMFLDRDVLQVGFQWHTIYDGCIKLEQDKAKIDTLYTVHINTEKKDHQLTHSLRLWCLSWQALLLVDRLWWNTILLPPFPVTMVLPNHSKFLETLETHKHVQNKLASLVILDLESLDLHAKQSTKQLAILVHDVATAIAEKQNPSHCPTVIDENLEERYAQNVTFHQRVFQLAEVGVPCYIPRYWW